MADANSPISVEPVPEVLANSAGFLLNRATRIIREMNEHVLSVLQLSPRELGILRIIDSEGPLTQQALGKKHSVDRSTVVQIIDDLEQRQLVTRVANKVDRRSNLLYLTKRGQKTLSQAVRLIENQQKVFLEPIEDAEWELLRVCLIKLINAHRGGEPN